MEATLLEELGHAHSDLSHVWHESIDSLSLNTVDCSTPRPRWLSEIAWIFGRRSLGMVTLSTRVSVLRSRYVQEPRKGVKLTLFRV